MIFEWYSGSDTTGRVASVLSAFFRDWRDMSQAEIVAVLEPLLSIERDPNVRALLFTRIAQAKLYEGSVEEAVKDFRQAESLFDIFAANFRDVRTEYRLMLESLLFQDESTRGVTERASYANAYLSSMDLPSCDEEGVATIAGSLAQGLIRLGDAEGQQVLYRMALSWAMRAHHLAPYDEEHLLLLAHCYSRLGDAVGVARMAKAIDQLAPGSEQTEIVRTLLKST